MTNTKKYFASFLLFGLSAFLILPLFRNRNRQTAVTNAVKPDSVMPLQLESLPTPDGVIPRFNKKDVGDVSTPKRAINAANEIAKSIIIDTVKNPLQAIQNILPQGAIIPSANPKFTAQFTNEYDNEIIAAAAENGIAPEVLKQLLIAESGLVPSAKNPNGEDSVGIAQIRPATHGDFARIGEVLGDAKADIHVAARIIRWGIDRGDGTVNTALTIYNGGRGNWKRGTVSMAAKQYAQKILTRSGFATDDDFSDVAP